jgi:hypothetical protein
VTDREVSSGAHEWEKVRTKYSCWSVGTIYDSRELPGVSNVGLGVDGVLQVVLEPTFAVSRECVG